MPYNLENPTFRLELFEEDNKEIFGDVSSDDEEDHLSEISDEDISERSDDDNDTGTGDASIDKNLPEPISLDVKPRIQTHSALLLTGENGFTWQTQMPRTFSDQSIVPEDMPLPGPKGAAKVHCKEICDYWEILFDQRIIDIIVDNTNLMIKKKSLEIIAKEKYLGAYHLDTNAIEIRAFLGILYYTGLWRTSHIDTEELWSRENGTTFYKCVMPRERYIFLSMCLRFDDKNTRQKHDKFAPIREMWEIFMDNCQRHYYPHKNCTVDKQFLYFRGRCRFRARIKSKPNKNGLKIVTLNDAHTSYLINGIPYLGNYNNKGAETISEYLFRVVTTPIQGLHRAVTCDNWFTSIRLLLGMREPPYTIKITGEIGIDKPEIPVEMKVADRTPPSTKFCFTPTILLLSHTTKRNKVVLISSTEQNKCHMENDKPKIMLDYNRTKGGADRFEKLCKMYSTSRPTRRWSLQFFFRILDSAFVNARILHKCYYINRCEDHTNKITARQYLKKLIHNLVQPYVEKRYEEGARRPDVKKALAGILLLDNSEVEPTAPQDQRLLLARKTRCRLCLPSEDKKTKRMCDNCKRPMCEAHRSYLCIQCARDD